MKDISVAVVALSITFGRDRCAPREHSGFQAIQHRKITVTIANSPTRSLGAPYSKVGKVGKVGAIN